MRLTTVILVVLCLALIPACQPAEPSVNDEEAPAANNSSPAEPETPAPPKEANYPYQVNAELARVYLKYNITDEAMRLYDLAIQQQLKQTNTEDAELWIGLGDALKNAERKEEAVKAYQRALQILEIVLPNAKTVQQHNHIIERTAAVCAVLGLEDERVDALAKLKADDDNPAQQLELARIFQQLGNVEKSEAHFTRAMELTQEDPAQHAVVRVAYGNMLFGLERYDDAMPLAKAAMDTEQADKDTRKAARRLVFELYEARGEADKLEFKD